MVTGASDSDPEGNINTFGYDFKKDPNPENTIFESLCFAGDELWRDEAKARLIILERENNIALENQGKSSAFFGGLVDFLTIEHPDEINLVVNEAVELVKDSVEDESNQGACITQLAIALARRDMRDAAIDLMPCTGGPIPEENEFFVHLALAESFARTEPDDESSALTEMELAFDQGASVQKYGDYYERVFQASLDAKRREVLRSVESE